MHAEKRMCVLQLVHHIIPHVCAPINMYMEILKPITRAYDSLAVYVTREAPVPARSPKLSNDKTGQY